jgi:hypothetical protein
MTIRLPHGATLSVSGNYTPEFHQKGIGNRHFADHSPEKAADGNGEHGLPGRGNNPLGGVRARQLPPAQDGGIACEPAAANNLENPRSTPSVSYQNDHGTYQLEASQQGASRRIGIFNYTGGALRCCIATLLSRQLTDGFAVVDANGVRA